MATQTQGWTLAKIIEATGLVEVLRVTDGKKQVTLLHRVKDKKKWIALIGYLLAHRTCWEAHICQQYFLRGDSLVYGWNFILQPTKTLKEAVLEIGQLVEKGQHEIPKSVGQGQLDSFPLMGASPKRTMPAVFDPRQPGPERGGPSQKGAHSIGGRG